MTKKSKWGREQGHGESSQDVRILWIWCLSKRWRNLHGKPSYIQQMPDLANPRPNVHGMPPFPPRTIGPFHSSILPSVSNVFNLLFHNPELPEPYTTLSGLNPLRPMISPFCSIPSLPTLLRLTHLLFHQLCPFYIVYIFLWTSFSLFLQQMYHSCTKTVSCSLKYIIPLLFSPLSFSFKLDLCKAIPSSPYLPCSIAILF